MSFLEVIFTLKIKLFLIWSLQFLFLCYFSYFRQYFGHFINYRSLNYFVVKLDLLLNLLILIQLIFNPNLWSLISYISFNDYHQSVYECSLHLHIKFVNYFILILSDSNLLLLFNFLSIYFIIAFISYYD